MTGPGYVSKGVRTMRTVRAELQGEMETRLGRLTRGTPVYRIVDYAEPLGWGVHCDVHLWPGQRQSVMVIVSSAYVEGIALDQVGPPPVLDLAPFDGGPTYRERWFTACSTVFLDAAERGLRAELRKAGYLGG